MHRFPIAPWIFLFLLGGLTVRGQAPSADASSVSPTGTKRYVVAVQRQFDQDACAGQHGIRRDRVFRHAINGFVADLDATAVERLKKDGRVRWIREDHVAAASAAQIVPTGIRRIAVDVFPESKIDGVDERIDVDVAIIDSGIQTNHPDLNVFRAVDFTGLGLFGSNPHGTQCAGIVGAMDNDFGVVGIAPGARLWSVRAAQENGTSYLSDLHEAFDYVAAHADEIEVVSCSFSTAALGYGTMRFRSDYEDPIRELVNRGVVVVAGAGNNGRDIAGPNGNLNDGGYTDNALPAALPQVMAVSAMDPVGDQFAGFSNFSAFSHATTYVLSPGAAIDVAGPGVNLSTTTVGSTYDHTYGGTSAATPYAAGVVALYTATHGRATDPAGVYRVRQAIVDAAQPQSQWQNSNTFDGDANHEGLARPSLAWAANAPQLTSIVKAIEGVDLSYTTTAGYKHLLQYAGDLNSPIQWTDALVSNGTGSLVTVNDPTLEPRRFYRVATETIPWPTLDSAIARNLGSAGSFANGIYRLATRGVPGAIVSDSENRAARMTVENNGSRVSIPFHPGLNPSGSFSVEFWYLPAQPAVVAIPVVNYEYLTAPALRLSGWYFRQINTGFSNGNGMAFRCYNTSGQTAYTDAAANLSFDAGSWYHIAGVFDGANVRLYVNGIQIANTALPAGSSFRPNPSRPMNFGASGEGGAYVGDLDELTVYSYALTPARILAHYQIGTSATPPVPYRQVILNDAPVGYWPLDEVP